MDSDKHRWPAEGAAGRGPVAASASAHFIGATSSHSSRAEHAAGGAEAIRGIFASPAAHGRRPRGVRHRPAVAQTQTSRLGSDFTVSSLTRNRGLPGNSDVTNSNRGRFSSKASAPLSQLLRYGLCIQLFTLKPPAQCQEPPAQGRSWLPGRMAQPGQLLGHRSPDELAARCAGWNAERSSCLRISSQEAVRTAHGGP